MNMAIDEYLMTHVTDTPIFRIYGWSNPCVSIGYFQSINDIDFQKCRNEAIDVVRRITGGGSVFHEKELTYSFVSRKYPTKIIDSYQEICQIIIYGLNTLGINAKCVKPRYYNLANLLIRVYYFWGVFS